MEEETTEEETTEEKPKLKRSISGYVFIAVICFFGGTAAYNVVLNLIKMLFG